MFDSADRSSSSLHGSSGEAHSAPKSRESDPRSSLQIARVNEDGKFSCSVTRGQPAGDAQTGETSPTPLFTPSARPPMAVVQLVHDGTRDYTPYPFFTDRLRIGRTSGDILVPHDFWISGRHAELRRWSEDDCYHWYLVDLNSTNGTFVRQDIVQLEHGTELILGRERFRFDIEQDHACINHLVQGKGERWYLQGDVITIGRNQSSGLACFAGDPFLSPSHAQLLRNESGGWSLHDLNSTNGIWLRVNKIELFRDTEFQLGEQRFKFWCPCSVPPTINTYAQ